MMLNKKRQSKISVSERIRRAYYEQEVLSPREYIEKSFRQEKKEKSSRTERIFAN